MHAYFGGRAEARIRRTAVPVAYCDFLSMYPTVNALMGLWDVLTADTLEVVDATEDVRALLAGITTDRVLDPTLWPQLRFFALVEADEDVLPLRAQYSYGASQYGIGVNCVTEPDGLWLAGPDVVASALLSGKPPRIRRAFRLVPRGQQTDLRPVALRGSIRIDPVHEDFFRRVIETRREVQEDATRPEDEREALQQFLKILANSSGYGIFAEMNPQDVPESQRPEVTVYGPEQPFTAKPIAPEKLGEYCFPPLAALTTAGARLMLALLERLVTDARGCYAFCDTDSMAIVATPTGGLVPCEGGSHTLPDGTPAVNALSFAVVDAIVARLAALNPYDPRVVPGSILKQEYVRYGPDGERALVEAFAISAKRYALFHRDPDGSIRLLKVSEHGLGHLLDPRGPAPVTDDLPDTPAWIVELWQWLLARELGRDPPEPPWFAAPALSRLTISTASLAGALTGLNQDKAYSDTVKPMNFVLSAQVAAFGHPEGVDPTTFHLLAPYEADPARWGTLAWFNKYTGESVDVSTDPDAPPHVARITTVGDVAREYAVHPEPKAADAVGLPCGRATRGLLQRRHVRPGTIAYIGKEANRIEEVDLGLVHAADEVRATYGVRDTWARDIVPVLQRLPAAQLATWGRCSVRTIKNLRNGHTQPSPGIRRRLERAVAEWKVKGSPNRRRRRRSPTS
jgi:hypothetical protein